MERAGAARSTRSALPAATLTRLASYLGVLNTLTDQSVTRISSGALAESAGVNPAQLRKDLSQLGSYGTRGVGYEVEHLRSELARQIGSAPDWTVIIVGIGNLGRALVNHPGFVSRGFEVTALFDDNPRLAGVQVEGLDILPLSELARRLPDPARTIGVVATPVPAAQDVCDLMVASGIRALLNFAPVNLAAPAGVTVRNVDLGSELQILAYHHQLSLTQARLVEHGGECVT